MGESEQQHQQCQNEAAHNKDVKVTNSTSAPAAAPAGTDEELSRRGKGKLVLVAMDGHDVSSRALKWALDNIVLRKNENEVDSDEIVLLHAQQLPPANCNLGITTPEVIESIKEQGDDAIINILDKGRKLCEEHNVKVRTIVKVGDPRDHICEMVEKLRADAVVMGNHGHGTLKRVLLGSTSDYCVHHAKCHVIITKDVAPGSM